MGEKIAVLALTSMGEKTAGNIAKLLSAPLFCQKDFPLGLSSFVHENFKNYDGFVFVMATGIVIRIIAPLLKGKAVDPAVVVVDEKGSFSISLLSGHLGGANALAQKVADLIGAIPVITTATDVHGLPAFDVLAKMNHCQISNLDQLKYISGALVNGKKVGLYAVSVKMTDPAISQITLGIEQENNVVISNRRKMDLFPSEHTLILRPQNLILGIGCKKNTPCKDLEEAVNDFMDKNNRAAESLCCVASIDLKKNEKCIVQFCEKRNIPFIFLPKEKLAMVEGEFETSAFVKNAVGVGSVCEASAAYAVKGAEIICKKTVYPGITLALGEILPIWKWQE